MAKRIILILLVLSWASMIFCLSNTDSMNSEIQTEGIFKSIATEMYKVRKAMLNMDYNDDIINDFVARNYVIFRKFCHTIVYLVFTLLVSVTTYVLFNFDIYKTCIVSFCISLMYSLFDEIHQSTVLGRKGTLKDVLIDCIGIISASLIYFAICKIRDCRSWGRTPQLSFRD